MSMSKKTGFENEELAYLKGSYRLDSKIRIWFNGRESVWFNSKKAIKYFEGLLEMHDGEMRKRIENVIEGLKEGKMDVDDGYKKCTFEA